MKKSLTKECPECKSTNVIYNRDRDELICQDCGLIFAELADELEDAEEEVSIENVPKRKEQKTKKKRR